MDTWVQMVIGFGGVVSVVWLWVVRPLTLATKRIATDLRDMITVKEDIAEIKAELHPNGGSSLRDAVNRTEIAVKGTNKRLDDHIRYHLENK